MIEASALLRCHNELLDGLGVVVELGDGRSLLERQEVVPFGSCLGEFRADHGEGCIDAVALDLGPLGDLSADIPNALSCSTTPSCSLSVSDAR
jgi:hypothetical protein